jgi:hypothetical protein
VALKRGRRGVEDAIASEPLKREARTAADITHPNALRGDNYFCRSRQI